MTETAPDDADALPEPLTDIATRTLPLVEHPIGARIVRIHRATDSAIWFGRDPVTSTFRVPTNRFDSPDRSYGVLYAAASREGAFAESIGRKPRSFRSDAELAQLLVTHLELSRPVQLVDLHGGVAVGAIGATGVVGVGPQSLSRRWAKALHAHPDQPDGVEYRCRHNSDELAVALFDRVGDRALRVVESTKLTSDRAWLGVMRARHQVWEPPT